MNNKEYMLSEQLQREEVIRKNIKIIKSLQSEVLKLEKKNVDLRVAHSKLVREEKEYENFNIDVMHAVYNAIIAEKGEGENKYNQAKNLVIKSGEETSGRLNKLCDKYMNMVENTNNVLKPGIQELMMKMESYNIELDDCKKQTADLMAKDDELDSQDASLNKEITELHAIIPQKQTKRDDLKVEVVDFENAMLVKNQELQDKLSAYKEENEALNSRLLELKERLELVEAESKSLAKKLEKLKTIHKNFLKWNDGSLKELSDAPSLEDMETMCKSYERKSEVIVPQIERLEMTLATPQAADNQEQFFAQLQVMVQLFGKITLERKISFQDCGEPFVKMMNETEYTYKKVKNVFEKLMVLHEKIQESESKTLKKCEAMEVDVDPPKSSTNRCDIEMENSEPLQKKAKYSENSALLENKEVETKSLNEVDVSTQQLKLSKVLLQMIAKRYEGVDPSQNNIKIAKTEMHNGIYYFVSIGEMPVDMPLENCNGVLYPRGIEDYSDENLPRSQSKNPKSSAKVLKLRRNDENDRSI